MTLSQSIASLYRPGHLLLVPLTCNPPPCSVSCSCCCLCLVPLISNAAFRPSGRGLRRVSWKPFNQQQKFPSAPRWVCGRVEVFFAYYCNVQGNIRSCFVFIPFALVVGGQILMSQIVSLKTQLCLGEFKTGWNCL